MVRFLRDLDREELGLYKWPTLMGPYPLENEVGMSLDFKILRFLLRKGRHAEHLQWD